jgi:hypothetical protein
MKKAIAVLGVVTLAAILIFLYRVSQATVPEGQPELVRVSPSAVVELRKAFNRASAAPRVLVLLSPT